MARKIAALVLMAAVLWLACSKNNKSTSIQTGSIDGRVTADGVGVSGVTISVMPYVITQGGDKIDDTAASAQNASDGDYHFDILPGTYRVYFDVIYMGEHLTTARYPIIVAPGENVSLNVELKDPAPSNLLVRESDAAVIVTFEKGYGSNSQNIYRSLADQDNFTLVGTTSNYDDYGGVTYTDDPPAIQRYKYKATSVSNLGESGPSNMAEIDFTGLILPPTGLIASDQINFVRLEWNSKSNAIQYKVYRSSTQNVWGLIASTVSNSYADTPGTFGNYYYRITAVSNYATESNPTNQVLVNYDGRLDPPELLTIVDRGSMLYLTWASSDQAIYYNIYRSINPDNNYAKIDSTLSADYIDRPIANGRYYYKVTVMGPNALESNYSSTVSVDFDGFLDPPHSISAIDQGLTVQLNWYQVNWAGAYVIYRSDDNGTTFFQISRISSDHIQYTDAPPSAGTYYYKIATETIDGILGPLSEPVMVHYSANLFAPEIVYAQNMGSFVIVGWSESNGAVAYSIDRSSSPTGDYVELEDSISSPPFRDVPSMAGSYYYRVQAFDNHGHRSALSPYGYVYYTARPLPPSSLFAEDEGFRVSLSWSYVGTIDSFLIYRATSFNGNYIPQLWSSWTNAFDWPPASGRYYYKIQSFYEGISSDLSDCAPVYFTGRLETPENLQGYDAGTSVRLSWDTVIGASSYDVYRGTSPDGMALNQTVYASEATDTPPNAGAYYYAIVAKTQGGLASPMCSPVLVEFTP